MRENEKLISVIVAAYNIENYLPKCMDSLLGQTYENLEIILVDDGSVDKTSEICDLYAAGSSKVKVIHKKNGGLSSARNAGLAVANGDFIGFVDGDDFIEPDMYRDMITACLEYNAEIAICAYREVGGNSVMNVPTGHVIELDRQKALEWYIGGHQQYHIYNSVWSKLFARKILSGITFEEGRKSEDIMYTTMALVKASKCVFLDTPYYNYVLDREGSIMNSKVQERRFKDEIPFLKDQIAFLERAGLEKLSWMATHQFYRNMLFYYIDFIDNEMPEGAKKLVKLLREEKALIGETYKNEFVPTGDKVRMKVFLVCPKAYYLLVKIYEKTIVRIRQ